MQFDPILGKLTSGGVDVPEDVVSSAVENWLDRHPEATTSVADGSISVAKLDSNVKDMLTQAQTSAESASADASQAAKKADSATEVANQAKTTAEAKQDKLVSGTNIKTVNGQSLLGDGDITIEGATGGSVSTEASFWAGKELVWNGDSISYGSWLSNPTTEAYPYQVAEALGMGISNYAIGGSYASKPEGSFDEYYWDYAKWQSDVAAGKVDTNKKYLVKDHNSQAKPCRVYAYSGSKWTATSTTGGWALVERVDEHIALHPDADLTVIAVGTNDFYMTQPIGSIDATNYRSLEGIKIQDFSEDNLINQGIKWGYGYRLSSAATGCEPFMPAVGDSLYNATIFTVQYVPLVGGKRYKAILGASRTWFLDANKNPIATVNLASTESSGAPRLSEDFTPPEGTVYANISFSDVAEFNNPTPDTVWVLPYDYQLDSSAISKQEYENLTKSNFCGAVHTICRKLLNAYKGKNKDILFITPIKRYQPKENGTWDCKYPEDKNSQGKTLEDYVDAIIKICGYYSIPVLDLYRISGMNPHIDTSLFGDTDGKAVHPNLEGHRRMASFVTAFLKNLRK